MSEADRLTRNRTPDAPASHSLWQKAEITISLWLFVFTKSEVLVQVSSVVAARQQQGLATTVECMEAFCELLAELCAVHHNAFSSQQSATHGTCYSTYTHKWSCKVA